MKITKRARILALVVGSGIVVASSACGVDTVAPTAAPRVSTPERVSSFVPTEASKALVGVTDGTYVVTFNPAENQVFSLGPNRLEIPANAICKIGTSSYGSAYWNSPCAPETGAVTLKITVKGASGDSPVVDFQPAMRFNPGSTVSLYFYVPKVTRSDAKEWTILYCGSKLSGASSGKCVNEALTDRDLRTYIDYEHSILFRRIKHFSAYKVDGTGYTIGE